MHHWRSQRTRDTALHLGEGCGRLWRAGFRTASDLSSFGRLCHRSIPLLCVSATPTVTGWCAVAYVCRCWGTSQTPARCMCTACERSTRGGENIVLTESLLDDHADDEGSIAHSPWSVHDVRNGLDESTHRHDCRQHCRTWTSGTYPCAVIRARMIRRSCTSRSEATVSGSLRRGDRWRRSERALCAVAQNVAGSQGEMEARYAGDVGGGSVWCESVTRTWQEYFAIFLDYTQNHYIHLQAFPFLPFLHCYVGLKGGEGKAILSYEYSLYYL